MHRDIAELQDVGFDIVVTKRERRVTATLEREQTYSPVSITKRERFTLLAVRNVFDVLRGTPFLDDIHAVMSKLDQRMSEEREEHRASGERFIYPPDHGTKSYAGKAEHLRASTFTIPADFDMRQQLHGAFGPHLADETGPHDVVVEFSREKAALASSRQWRPTQTIEQVAGSRGRIAFTARWIKARRSARSSSAA